MMFGWSTVTVTTRYSGYSRKAGLLAANSAIHFIN